VSILVPQRKDDEAEWHCQEVLRLRPDCAEAYFNRGLLRLTQGRLDEAIGCFRGAVELIPEAANMHVGLGGALLAQGRTDEAIAEYRQALRLKPDDFQTHLHIGAALQMQGRLDEAVAYYRKALSLDPTDAQTHNDISIALMLQGQSAEAVTHCRAALKIRPDWVDPMLRIASILATHPEAGLGKPEEAVRLAKRAADLTQHSDVQVQNILATAYAAAGQFDQAIATVEAALQLESALSKDKETADGMRRKLEAYRQGRLPADRPGSAGRAAP
jgi:tetratricopeptide (TPR) repeat protein